MSKLVAIVTGASRGIGLSIYNKFLSEGIDVVGVALHRSESSIECDITKEHEVEKVVSDTFDKYGHLDILVNCAGIVTSQDIVDTSVEQWNRVISTNLTGAFIFSKHTLRYMKQQRSGKIINIGSIAGRHRSISASVEYTCSKYGLIGLTRQLAYQYSKYNININCVCPSQTKTDMLLSNFDAQSITELESNIPIGRLAVPNDISNIVYFLVTEQASYVSGAVLDVNGGQI
jgi:3-oxoacyl-[acyl-carrier protein] reductase